MNSRSPENTDPDLIIESINSTDDIYLSNGLSASEFNRLRIYYGSKLSDPLICDCTVSFFTSFRSQDKINPITSAVAATDGWTLRARGALILQNRYDAELTRDICGSRIIVANVETCDLIWSVSLHSWNEYRCVDGNFHMISKWSRDSELENEDIAEDYTIGIYFPVAKAADKFKEFVSDFIDRIIIYENRSLSIKKKAIKQEKIAARKMEPIQKSSISAPIMFSHTLHIDKSS